MRLISHGAPTAVEASETREMGFIQRRVREGRRREEVKIERPIVVISFGDDQDPPAAVSSPASMEKYMGSGIIPVAFEPPGGCLHEELFKFRGV